MEDAVSIRLHTKDYERLIAISGRLSNKEKRRVSLADTMAAVIDEYPKPKKAGK